jgi:poly-gamma-glutamate capsule biosynthesis protein CapA/YwtB (metallophosphatase superfamily)
VLLGRALVDAGADVVWGNHPHVLQGAEIYNGKPILYSCGNMISPLPGSTALFRLTFEEKKLQSIEVLPASISGGRVALLSAKQVSPAVAQFQSLCRLVSSKYPSRAGGLIADLMVSPNLRLTSTGSRARN